MQDILIEATSGIPAGRQQVEIVERKGLGHPDTICDALMEAASVALCAAYRERSGQILHHNLDKSLLVAGQSSPAPGGGTVDAPMRIIFGDRATAEWKGIRIPVGEIVEAEASRWFREHLRFVDPQKHLILQNEIRPGSPELVDIFARKTITANDTSAAVGYAPLSETEQIVLEVERYLNAREFKARHPEAGEDIKVMAVRRGRTLFLTIAVAFVDCFITDERVYFDRKATIETELLQHLRPRLKQLDDISLQINTLDDPERGTAGMYLTVLGTSAEGADGGEVGRGNRVNGLISLNRPMSMEAAAGKNPVCHVGKIYNLLSHHIARRLHSGVAGLDEVYVWMCSQIGRPLQNPWSVSVNVTLAKDAAISDVDPLIRSLIQQELQDIENFTARLSRGEIPVC